MIKVSESYYSYKNIYLFRTERFHVWIYWGDGQIHTKLNEFIYYFRLSLVIKYNFERMK